MSRFFSTKYQKLTPYTPGEQPKDQKYIKLNTNESPFPPSPKAQAMAKEAAENLQLYSDPTCAALVEKTNQPVCFMEPLKENESVARVFYVAMRKVRYRHKESWIGLMGRGGTTDFEILGETDDKTRYYRKYDNRTQEVKWLTSLPATAVPNPVSEANWRERTEIQACTARHKEPVTALTYPASIALIAVDIPASVVTSVASGTWATLYLTWLLITGDTNILI